MLRSPRLTLSRSSVALFLMLIVAITHDMIVVSVTQRYQSIDKETFDLYSSDWKELHRNWISINPDYNFCDEASQTTVYPICVENQLVKEVYTDSQLVNGEMCPAVMCYTQAPGDANCAYTPFDTMDYLPPVATSTLDNDTICAGGDGDNIMSAEISSISYGMDLGIPPLYLPIIPVRLNITGRVTAMQGDQCLPVVNAKIVAWQVDPTSLNAFSIDAQFRHTVDKANAEAAAAEGNPFSDPSDNPAYQQNNPQTILNDTMLANAPRNHSLRAVSCRATQHTNQHGDYSFRTLVPPAYGPPRHIMFQVSAEGYSPLTTRMYFDADWRLLQLTTLGADPDSPLDAQLGADSHSLALKHARDANANSTGTGTNLLPGVIARDPRVAKLTFEPSSDVEGGLVSGVFSTDFNFVLRPLRPYLIEPTTATVADGAHLVDAQTVKAAADGTSTTFTSSEYDSSSSSSSSSSKQDATDDVLMPPIDVAGLWADANGALVLVETHGPSFLAIQYPHARTWGAARGVIVGNVIRGVDFQQVLSQQDVLDARRQRSTPWADLSANAPSSSSTVWTAAGTSTGTVVPSSPYSSSPFHTQSPPESVSIQWSTGASGGAAGSSASSMRTGATPTGEEFSGALWTKLSRQTPIPGTSAQPAAVQYDGAAAGYYRYLKLLVTRETGGGTGVGGGGSKQQSSLTLNEIEFFEGVLSQLQNPLDGFKMKTPRTPSPQMVTCSTFLSQDRHCYKAFDGDASSSSAWVSQPVGSRRHQLAQPQWVTFDFGLGRGVRPTAMRLVCNHQNAATATAATAAAEGEGPTGCPMTFQLLGSADNVKFDLLYQDDLYDYVTSSNTASSLSTSSQTPYGEEGKMFYFAFDTVRGRILGQRCGSCTSGPAFTCNLDAYDATCNSRYCGSNGLCQKEPLCPAGEYMKYGFKGFNQPAFQCEQCGAGRYGAVAGLRSSACSGGCARGYYCPPGSTSPTQFACGAVVADDGLGSATAASAPFAGQPAGPAFDAGASSGMLGAAVLDLSRRWRGASAYCPEGSSRPITAAAGRRTINAAEEDALHARNVSLTAEAAAEEVDVEALVDDSPLGRFTRTAQVVCARGHYCRDGVQTPCPAGSFGNTTGLATAACTAECEDGDYCPAGSVVPTSCPPGYYCPDGKAAPVICPAGTYGATTGLTESLCSGLCAAGYYCPAGSTSPMQVACPAGRYGDVAGLTDAACSGLCREGYFCPAASTQDTQQVCGGAHVYCPVGSALPVPVSRGFYTVDATGTATNHSAHTRTAQRAAEAGFYSTPEGERWPCVAGCYGATTGLSALDGVEIATFAPTVSPTEFSGPPYLAPTPGPSNTSAPTAAPTEDPTASPTDRPTPLPTFSPSMDPTILFNPTSTPTSAVFESFSPTFGPTASDLKPRTNYRCSGLCAPGHYCPAQSTSAEQVPCPAGRFGNASGLTTAACTAVCPVGHYCPTASVVPLPCPAGVFGNTTGRTDATCSDQACTEGQDGSGGGGLLNCSGSSQLCFAGYFCPEGSIQGDQWQCGGPDRFCPAGSQQPQMVSEGYYSVGGKVLTQNATALARIDSLEEEATFLVYHTRDDQRICEEGHYCVSGIKRRCPAGRFGSEKGLSHADCSGLCAAGHYCPEGSHNATSHRCPAGRYGATMGLSNSACTGRCTQGFHCPPASVSPTELQCAVIQRTGVVDAALGVPVRTFVEDAEATARDFPRNISAVRSNVYLDGAHYNVTVMRLPNTNVTQVQLVEANSVYCPEGTASPLFVRRGYYTAGGNRTTRFTQEPCPMGSYCVNGVISSCPAGRYGRAERLTEATCTGLCAKGHYCPAGSSSSTTYPCPIGRYGASEGLATSSCSGPCQRPRDCPTVGSTEARPRM